VVKKINVQYIGAEKLFVIIRSGPVGLTCQSISSSQARWSVGTQRARDLAAATISSDKPKEMPPPQLLLLPLLVAAVAAANSKTTWPSSSGGPPPVPTPWPEQFHAVMFTNLTESGGRLQLVDLYYDWPGGRNLNLIRNQLSGDPTYDVEWTNGTSYIFDSASCRTIRFPVGLLPPDWLAGATYLGRESVDGFDCHLWTKVDFVWYYEEVATGRPVRWNFFNGRCPLRLKFVSTNYIYASVL
jgi:hypothetical protein